MDSPYNQQLIGQAKEWTENAAQYLDLASKNLDMAMRRMQLVQTESETIEAVAAGVEKFDQLRTLRTLADRTRDAATSALDFADLERGGVEA